MGSALPNQMISTTQGLVSNTNNPFIATDYDPNHEKKVKKTKKTKTKGGKLNAIKSGPGFKNNAIAELDKDGNIIKARSRNVLANEGEELEKNVLED